MGGKKGNLDDCKDGEKQKENIDASIFSSNRKNAVPVESDELFDYNGLQG